MTTEEVVSLIKLSKIKGIGEVKLKKLISKFKPISEVFRAHKSELYDLIGKELVPTVREAYKINVDPELAVLSKIGARVITFEDYPTNLKSLPDAPPILYIIGEITIQDELSIGIIGTRHATHYGRTVAEKLASEFALSGITIISGLARGIDSYAHQGALNKGGRTIAVLGCGIDIVYPPENRELMNKICEHGACISEFPIGTQPWKGNFPTRNRLISGLSKAVVVIEASERSGIFSTVQWALEQGREVFAVPGNITSETSKGVNRLIADGAQIITSAQDVMEYMGIKPVRVEKEEPKLSADETKIWECLCYEPVHVDKLAETLKLPVSKLLGFLLNMELQGIVKQLPGRNFIKNI